MSDYLIPFTEQELKDLLRAIDAADFELGTNDPVEPRWAQLKVKLLSYSSKKS